MRGMHSTGRAGKAQLVVGLIVAAGVAAAVYFLVIRKEKGPDNRSSPVVKNGKPSPSNGTDKPSPSEPAKPKVSDDPKIAAAKPLYDHQCAPCHGLTGEGNGDAARFLYPKPRNFSEGDYRLVTTVNRKPSDMDLFNAITRGMPGSAMIPFAHLKEEDRQSLVGYIRHLAKSVRVEKRKAKAIADGEEPDLTALAKEAEEFFRPGEALVVAAKLPAGTAESLKTGREHYLKVCAGCHGQDGRASGEGIQDQKNNDGMPTRPRDLTLGFFKGSRDPAQLYSRIMLGMPGSPMPEVAKEFQNPEAIGHIINYIGSLSDAKQDYRFEHKRTTLAAKKTAGLPENLSEDIWQGAKPANIVVSPLWWREFAVPDLQVAAVHDGKTLAVRLTWKDATQNTSVVKPEDFEDMVAVQLYKGDKEPFLGMGSADAGQLDLWLWRATWQHRSAELPTLLDDYPFDMKIYQDLLKGKEKLFPNFPARSEGNMHAHDNNKQSASSLVAKGFGSTTFRSKASQVVTANSSYKDGQWTVVLRRPLAVKADEGLSFTSGDQVSAAFAIWDGAARDRNGQKMISIWHDLKLE